jgi:hypothetical protein
LLCLRAVVWVSKGLIMVTDDKVAQAVNLDDNQNNRDQRNVGIWVLILVLGFMGSLILLGLSHAPNNGRSEEPFKPANQTGYTTGQTGNVESRTPDDPKFSVNAPVGEVELPDTEGKEQHFVTGHGNTPVPWSAPPIAEPAAAAPGPAPSAGQSTPGAAPAPAAPAATH